MEKQKVRNNVLKAFAQLRKEGYLAKANYLCCQTCAGYALTATAVKLVKAGKEIKGCVYWHKQDEKNFWKNGIFYLSFGPLDSKQHGKIGLPTIKVGKHVVAVLKQHSVKTEWDGTEYARIKVLCE
jgi:hypothetical protein